MKKKRPKDEHKKIRKKNLSREVMVHSFFFKLVLIQGTTLRYLQQGLMLGGKCYSSMSPFESTFSSAWFLPLVSRWFLTISGVSFEEPLHPPFWQFHKFVELIFFLDDTISLKSSRFLDFPGWWLLCWQGHWPGASMLNLACWDFFATSHH